MTIVGVAAIAFPWLSGGLPPENWTLHAILTPFGLILLGNVLHARTSRILLHADSVEKRSLVTRQSLRFADVQKIELDQIVFKQGSQEIIRLIGADRKIEIPELFRPFDQLRDTLLKNCRQATVQDLRA